jgi:hypothetical protein
MRCCTAFSMSLQWHASGNVGGSVGGGQREGRGKA